MRQVAMRLPLLMMIGLVLLAAMGAGLARLGIMLPGVQPGAIVAHGPLMIGGVLGTLISLERAVALSAQGRRNVYAYLAPLVTGLGGVLLALGVPGTLPKLLITVGSGGLVLIFGQLVRRHLASFTLVMGLGALCWLLGNLLWLAGQPVYAVVHWWVAFLVLTVVGERLELSRIVRLTESSKRLFLLAVAVFFSGVVLTSLDLGAGVRLAGLGEIALALWLLRYDIARQTIKRVGLPRFIAVCLLVGYIWLGIGGLFGLVFGVVQAGVQYELLLHALLLGFIFSMIFGHALIIIPAISGRAVPYRPMFYLPLIILHAALLARVIGGFTGIFVLRQWGGVFNVIAILLFLGMVAASALLSQPAAKAANNDSQQVVA